MGGTGRECKMEDQTGAGGGGPPPGPDLPALRQFGLCLGGLRGRLVVLPGEAERAEAWGLARYRVAGEGDADLEEAGALDAVH